MLRRRPAIVELPASFLFGVATADHQCEAYVPEIEDIRDVWERERGLTVRGQATDFWNRYAEDVELARSLGCTMFRFSIAWSRVETAPGQFSDAAFDHYREVIATIRAAGMEPLLTLHHFTWPVHLEARGGMVADEFPGIFERYAEEVAKRLGDDVRFWITFNEPTQLVYGYIKPWWERDYFVPPGLPEGATLDEQMDAVSRLIRNLFLAHTAARAVIKRHHPAAQVGANPLLLGLPGWLQSWVDRNATRLRSRDDLVRQGRVFSERALLEQGRVDVVVATLTRTREREGQVAFTETYYVAGQMLLVLATRSATGASDFAGRVVAVVKTSTAERDIRKLIPNARPLVVPDYDAARQALHEGKADALLADDTILRGLIARFPDQYRLVGEQLTHEPYAAAVARGNRLLFDVVNAAVQQFKTSGAWAESYARHLGSPVSPPPESVARNLADVSHGQLAQVAAEHLRQGGEPYAAPGTALRRVQERGYLIVGVKEDVPGFGYRDPSTDEFSGFEIDLAHEMARMIFGDASKVRFHPLVTRERIPHLRSPRRLLDPLLKYYSILSTMLTSNWWHLGMAGKLPEFLCPSECIDQQDFVGFDYYWGVRSLRPDRILRLVDAGLGHFDRAPVWPGALHDMLKYHARLFPNKPIIVVENGSVEAADGVERAAYLQRHWREVQRAVRDGVNVAGYVNWSITSNREWGHPFGPHTDFGLYHIALDHDAELKRKPTPSAETYRRIVLAHGVHRPDDACQAATPPTRRDRAKAQ